MDIFNRDPNYDQLQNYSELFANRMNFIMQSLRQGQPPPLGVASDFLGHLGYPSYNTPEDVTRGFDQAQDRLRGYGINFGNFDDRDNASPNTPTQRSTPPANNQNNSPLHGVVDSSQVSVPKSKGIRFDKEAFYVDITGKVIGQNQALRVLTELSAIHVGKTNPNRPLTVLLAGPTGTGKTLTAEQVTKLLAKYTGVDWRFIRIDMNQLTERTSVSRLLGADPNYVGYDDPPLFEPLLSNKYHVILLDEMEKGHPAVLKVLMNAMGNGSTSATVSCSSRATYLCPWKISTKCRNQTSPVPAASS